MPSPFPGMDPYLEDEKVWPLFHPVLVHILHQLLLPGLMDRYRARVAERIYTLEQVLFTTVEHQEIREPFLEIRQKTDGKLVTLVEVVSPANKIFPTGRQAYLKCRDQARQIQCNLVEIDLVLQGQSVVDYPKEGIPEWDYAVYVSRSNKPEQYEIYNANLDKRLPRFRFPLSADDRDTVVDLQAGFVRTFDNLDACKSIDYKKDPITKLSDTNRNWIQKRLQEQKLR